MPKIVDVDDQRRRVTDAAWSVIVDNGFDGATMRGIAARANCTTGLVTHYFKNKSDLLLAMIRHISNLARERITSAQEGLVGLDAARAVIVESLPISPSHAQEWRMWVALLDHAIGDERLRNEWQRRNEGWEGLVRSAINQAIELGELSTSAPVEEIVELCAALHYGIGVTSVLTPERLTPDKIAERVNHQIDFIVTAYGTAVVPTATTNERSSPRGRKPATPAVSLREADRRAGTY